MGPIDAKLYCDYQYHIGAKADLEFEPDFLIKEMSVSLYSSIELGGCLKTKSITKTILGKDITTPSIDLGCVNVSASISGELKLVMTDKEKSLSGRANIEAEACGYSIDQSLDINITY